MRLPPRICQTTDLIILGAGITGLAAGYFLRDKLSCVILDANNEAGGVIKTSKIGDFVLEQGPDCFMNTKPHVLDLSLKLGLKAKLIESKDYQRQVWLLKNGDLVPSDYENKSVPYFLGNRKTLSRTRERACNGSCISFRDGMQTLPHTLAGKLKNQLQLNTRITHLDPAKLEVTCNNGQVFKAKAILSTLPAYETSHLLNCHPGLDPGSSNSQPWSKFKTTTTTSLYLAYKRSAISHPLNGFGIIIPPTENKSLTAVTFVSSKFDHRCPANHVLFRVFTKQDLLVTLAKARVYADFEAIF
ncbi:MAG: FAD-dependent oxidoreductase, partial [Deltaproteobacteria bacterium]|nr:FAD-dependent oxidoreductase [Deltaproteobacteria bacterium]